MVILKKSFHTKKLIHLNMLIRKTTDLLTVFLVDEAFELRTRCNIIPNKN